VEQTIATFTPPLYTPTAIPLTFLFIVISEPSSARTAASLPVPLAGVPLSLTVDLLALYVPQPLFSTCGVKFCEDPPEVCRWF